MFSLNPSAYTTPQHFSPYSYSYNDYSNELLARGYLHALQQQQTRERQEAQYRAQLEEAARRRRLAEGMRRRNQHFDPFFMTGSEPYESLFQPRPRPQSTPHEYSRPVRRDAFEDHSPQMERRCESVNAKQQERQAFVERSPSLKSFPVAPGAKVMVEKITPSSSPLPVLDPNTRDAAARTIQSFVRPWLARLSALHAIDDISRRFEDIKTGFEFPSTLDFADSPSSSASSSSSSLSSSSSDETAPAVPSLLYTPRNAPLHGHEHALVKLLSDLDAVESRGDACVKRARKELVVRIERELGALDARKMDVWKGVVAEREMLAQGALRGGGDDDGEEGEGGEGGEGGEISLSSNLVEAENMAVTSRLDTEVEECDMGVNVDAQGNLMDEVDQPGDAEEKYVVELLAIQEDLAGKMDANEDLDTPVEESS